MRDFVMFKLLKIRIFCWSFLSLSCRSLFVQDVGTVYLLNNNAEKKSGRWKTLLSVTFTFKTTDDARCCDFRVDCRPRYYKCEYKFARVNRNTRNFN